jgi:glyoxylase-like metal-dependent hydrolase (beta-lactamase superfamily II)
VTPLIRHTFTVGPLGCNCTVVACPETHEGLVIDPGGEAPRILDELARLGVTAVTLFHTHAHFDHIMGTKDVAMKTRAEVALHEQDRWLYDNVEMQAGLFGMRAEAPGLITRALAGHETLAFGRREGRVIHTPGHTPGSSCLFLEAAGERPILFSGDTLFARSVGRTDLWGGDFDELARSITGPLFTLPETTLVVPGHGGETTIGEEREENPFVGLAARR